MKKDNMLKEIKRHMSVLMEDMRSQVKLVAEQYGSFIDRFDRIDAKLEEHDRRFEVIDARFVAVDSRFVAMGIRFDRIDLELGAMKTALFDNSHRLTDHDARIRKLEMS